MSDPKEHREQSEEDLAELMEDLEAPDEAAEQVTGGDLGIFKTTPEKVEAKS